MKPGPPVVSGCECCISRRRLLAAGCGACAASVAQGLFARLALAADDTLVPAVEATATRPRVRLIFACFTLKQERPTWPHIGYDFAPDIERVTLTLRQLCTGVEFLVAVAHTRVPHHQFQCLGSGHIDVHQASRVLRGHQARLPTLRAVNLNGKRDRRDLVLRISTNPGAAVRV